MDNQEVGLCDHELRCIRWENNSQDIVISFNSPNGTSVDLKAVWVTEFESHLKFTTQNALTWEVRFVKSADLWKVCVDFANVGDLHFTCSEYKIMKRCKNCLGW